MFFIGDVHGQYAAYFDWLNKFKSQKSIQVGDFGLGFGNATPAPWDMIHRFIRGNHDDPAACNAHSNHLGDYGVTEDGIFFVAGGYSIDVDWRKSVQHEYPYPIWWEDEEIAESEFEKILELYKATKPKIVVSHDCPSEIRDTLLEGGSPHRNRTSDGLLSAMFKAHQPELWVFGHYHESIDMKVN
ncbi:hypothetical protein LCGC14_2959640, partial [marine sediment metagenome]